MVDKYFGSASWGFCLTAEIRKMAFLKHHNFSDHLASKRHGAREVIFFLNMLNLLRRDAGTAFSRVFCQRLSDNGTLFIGQPECINENSVFS